MTASKSKNLGNSKKVVVFNEVHIKDSDQNWCQPGLELQFASESPQHLYNES